MQLLILRNISYYYEFRHFFIPNKNNVQELIPCLAILKTTAILAAKFVKKINLVIEKPK